MRCAIQIDVLPLPYLLFIFPRTIRDCLGQSLFHNVQLTFPAASLSSLIRFSSSDHFFQISNATLSVVLLPYIFLSNISPKFLSLKRQVLFHPIQLCKTEYGIVIRLNVADTLFPSRWRHHRLFLDFDRSVLENLSGCTSRPQ